MNLEKWIMLSIASLATLATSPAGYSRVVRVMAENQVVYARIVYESMSYKEMRTVFSQDGGRTWQETRNVPDELAQDVTLPRVVCESAELEVCYRIAQEEQVEESRDGGKTWRVVWSIPAGRREYMERARGSGWKWLAIRPIDMGPYDLAER